MIPDPDPRTANDDDEKVASNEGVSAPDPAEGRDDAPAGDEGSPNG
ncbi:MULTISPECIES: hypothetical protein [unclassified Sphingomonas]|nr:MULTISPECIES: hypothetical protein [unclassified Sphingomonas]MCC2978582.1 hypothetical protein [Sphingomonas sp. IC4-52]MCD2316131.1 hypothetical protein [Sphingomonas sp. IC-11]